VVLILLVAVVGYEALELIEHRARLTRSAPSFESMQISRLTTSGNIEMAALSPDGRYVAYVASQEGKHALWLRQIGTDSRVQIVPPSNGTYRGVAFSPDGNFVDYSQYEQRSGDWVLNRIPMLGGTSQRLIANIDSPVTFSPDGRRLAFVRLGLDGGSVFAANADGSDLQQLSFLHMPDVLERGGPSWSPDGKAIAASAKVIGGSWHPELLEVGPSGGPLVPMKIPSTPDWFTIDQVVWLPDGSSLLAVVQADPRAALDFGQIWQLYYPNGSARRITDDLDDYSGVSLSKDGKSLVTVQNQLGGNIWVGPANDTMRLHQITNEPFNMEGVNGLDWAPDGDLVYASVEGGSHEIWTMNSDGTNRQQLTSSPPNSRPRVTSSGRSIVFGSGRNGSENIWEMNLDGSNPRQLTHTGFAVRFDISSDSKWLVYTAFDSGTGVIYKMPLEGGSPAEIAATPIRISQAQLGASPLALSPDGKWIAVLAAMDQPQTAGLVFEIVPLDGGNLKRLKAPLLSFEEVFQPLKWTPDGKGLIFIHSENGASNLWIQPIDGGEPKQLTHFANERIFDFAFSRDGKRLAISRGTDSSDAVLIRNF
jgi:Tol biopolymer transport system component